MNNLPREKQIEAIAALTEGVSVRAAERLTGVNRGHYPLAWGPRRPRLRHAP